ncbi:MAG TPA: transglutaminase family protein [Gammaproteobacteria bacterium]|nr:transglutaminase family protein [Gammaproteobacteria bacterium]
MKYRVVHKTEYRYGITVSLCHNLAHLRPRNLANQQCLGHRLQIDPLPMDLAEHTDFFGNHVSYFSIQQPHQTLTVTATSEIELNPGTGQLALEDDIPWDEVRRRLAEPATDTSRENRQFVLDSSLVPTGQELADYAAPSFPPGRPLLESVRDLMARVHHEFTYDPGFSTVSTPLTEVLSSRRGVCQDFAHLAIACLRSLGLAARYVSGYLETLPPPGQAKQRGADESHAWFSVFLPDVGWHDFDPTNNRVPLDQHITTAWGRDYADVTPLKGVLFGGDPGHRPQVSVDMERLP